MANEKHDPWALLREARAFVLAGCAHGSISYTQWSREQHTAARVLNRIDAALAAHDAVPPSEEKVDSATPVVEWKQRQGSYIHDDGVNELRVYLWGDEWHWHTVVEYRADGVCATLDEAQRAALAAARGMK